MHAGRLSIVLLTSSLLCVPCITHAANSNEAVVTAVTLPMHAEMTKDSAVVRILRGGDTVTIDNEVAGRDGNWCFVTLKGSTAMGFVPCDALTRKAKGPDVRVLLYMTEW